MAVRAVRGATTATENTKEDIVNASKELVSEILSRNDINTDDITDITFTVTKDLTKAFPASAVRAMGITTVPLLDMQAPDIDGALKKCIRVIIRYNTDKGNADLHHVYLGEAQKLRPDIAKKENNR